MTELRTLPSAAVVKEVYVDWTVEEKTDSYVVVSFELIVARLMDSVPSVVGSALREDVVYFEVTVDPLLFVVVTSTVVGVAESEAEIVVGAVVDASEVADADVWPAAAVVDAVEASLVGVVDAAAAADEGVVLSAVELGGDTATEVSLVAVVGSADVVADMVEESAVVDAAASLDVVAPVPTTCRLGIIPSGIESARI